MKMIFPAILPTLAPGAIAVFCLSAVVPSGAGAEATDNEFLYIIQPEPGATEFASGDGIVITGLRGDRQHLEPGGRYLLEGTYTLASADAADLAWFATSRGPSDSMPVADDQHVKISKGSGNFRLKQTLRDDGWLHVSFYVNGNSHGGIYFGERGFENTVLRKKGWSDFRKGPPTGWKPGAAENGATDVTNPVNLAIMAYLGNPVPAPAGLDAKYSSTNLAAAFTALSQKAGLRVQKLAVDDSEFPFLVYGLLAGKHDFRELEKELREMNGYSYSGSVVGGTQKGSTYFSLDMIPDSQYPSGQSEACHRRLMIRLQMLADAVKRTE